jgi:hypothetical protein
MAPRPALLPLADADFAQRVADLDGGITAWTRSGRLTVAG